MGTTKLLAVLVLLFSANSYASHIIDVNDPLYGCDECLDTQPAKKKPAPVNKRAKPKHEKKDKK